jgi:KipI family sensor histidine kinase inhibitor
MQARTSDAVCYRVGRNAIAFECIADVSPALQRRIWRLTREAATWEGVTDVTAALQNLTLFLDPQRANDGDWERRLMDAWQRTRTTGDVALGSLFEIPVRYGGADGPDLAELAFACGLDESEVIARHCAGEYVVSFLGFAPGFAYLDGLDPALRAERRAVPRARVPAGSVGIGGSLTGVYPHAMPGGWNLIGRTERILFDQGNEPAALLSPGDQVAFVALP